jgi:hypothetical protein
LHCNVYFVGFSRADDAAEPATETVDADIGSSREGSRTGKTFKLFELSEELELIFSVCLSD